jgi:oligopeptide transport system substrate-binding protein
MKKALSLLVVMMLAYVMNACNQQTVNRDLGSQMIQDVNVRRAIALSIDKGYYTDTLLANGSYPADYYLPYDFYAGPGNEGVVDFRKRAEEIYGDTLPFDTYQMPNGDQAPSGYNHYNVQEARRLWEEARKEFGVGENEVVEFDFLVHSTQSWTDLYNHVKAEIERNLKNAKVNVISVTFGEKLNRAPSGDFDILFSGWGPDYMDPTTYLDLFMSENGHNVSGYSNPKYDTLVGNAKSGITTGQERFDALVEAEKILLHDDVVVLPIFQSNTVGLRRTEIKDLFGQKVGADYFLKWAYWDFDDTAQSMRSARSNNGKTELRLLQTSGVPDIKSFTTTDQVSLTLLAQFNEGLITAYDPKSETPYVNGMAESYTVSEDGLTYTFKLKENQPWVTSSGQVYTANGQPQYVTAADFEFAWKKLADPRSASQYSYLIETAGIKGSEVIYAEPTATDLEDQLDNLGVKATGPYELTVTLDFASDYFIGMLSYPPFYPVNEAFYNTQGENYGRSLEEGNILFNGPYYFSDWSNQYHILKKSPHYWDRDTVQIDTVTYIVQEGIQPNTAVQKYLNGEIDSVGLSSAALATQYGQREDVRISGSVTAWYLEFNVGNHPNSN